VIRLAHLSDLHFGAHEPAVVAALRADVVAQRVDQVLVSGDLTMRARSGQFAGARDLLDGFGVPWTAVPGNHDLPLDRPVTRAIRPLRGYRRHIDADVAPLRSRDGVLVLGLSTARRYYWKGGRIDAGQAARIGRAFRAAVPLKILMVHHPVFVSAQRPDESTVRGADRALRAAADAGVDIVLCGHDHVAAHADLSLTRPGLGRHMLGIMSGTSASHRVRADESQSYNVLELTGDDRLRLQVRQWGGDGFAGMAEYRWRRASDGWLEW
jgi:3',5'-cyclic AMP phosphodiesterase CpdA